MGWDGLGWNGMGGWLLMNHGAKSCADFELYVLDTDRRLSL
jgi:hypothetical protein